MIQKKKPWQSKTLWVNFIMAAFALFQPEWIPYAEDPTNVAVLFTVVNVILRLTTDKKIEIA